MLISIKFILNTLFEYIKKQSFLQSDYTRPAHLRTALTIKFSNNFTQSTLFTFGDGILMPKVYNFDPMNFLQIIVIE